MALSLDGSVHKNITSGSSTTVTLTTTVAGVVVLASTTNGSPLTSVSSSNTTGWAQRAGQAGDLELWYGVSAGALVGEVITVTWSGATSYSTLDVFGVGGSDTTSIWDPNGALPSSATNPPIPAVGSITTTNANDFLIAISRGGTGSPTADTGWTAVSGADFQLVQYKIVSATQSGTSVKEAEDNDTRLIADAIMQATSPPPPTFNPGWANRATSGIAGSGVS